MIFFYRPVFPLELEERLHILGVVSKAGILVSRPLEPLARRILIEEVEGHHCVEDRSLMDVASLGPKPHEIELEIVAYEQTVGILPQLLHEGAHVPCDLCLVLLGRPGDTEDLPPVIPGTQTHRLQVEGEALREPRHGSHHPDIDGLGVIELPAVDPPQVVHDVIPLLGIPKGCGWVVGGDDVGSRDGIHPVLPAPHLHHSGVGFSEEGFDGRGSEEDHKTWSKTFEFVIEVHSTSTNLVEGGGSVIRRTALDHVRDRTSMEQPEV